MSGVYVVKDSSSADMEREERLESTIFPRPSELDIVNCQKHQVIVEYRGFREFRKIELKNSVQTSNLKESNSSAARGCIQLRAAYYPHR